MCIRDSFYGVSVDYLLCRIENREQINTPLTELHLNDEMVALLKSGRINNRLLCELATHKDFIKFLADIEIYVDGIATLPVSYTHLDVYKRQVQGCAFPVEADGLYDVLAVGQDVVCDSPGKPVSYTHLCPLHFPTHPNRVWIDEQTVLCAGDHPSMRPVSYTHLTLLWWLNTLREPVT